MRWQPYSGGRGNKLPPEDRVTEKKMVLVTPSESELLAKAGADSKEGSFSSWARRVLVKAAERGKK